jgi:CheY-like chemotaxis protein
LLKTVPDPGTAVENLSMVRGNAMLPRTNSERTENTRTVERSLRSEWGAEKSKRVLLVNDHILFRQVLAIVLEQHITLDESLQVGSFAEARRVLTGYNSNALALAIVDLDLADEGGFELIEDLRRIETPVLAITTSRNSERFAQKSGADEVLTTAASGDDVLDVVRRLVD